MDRHIIPRLGVLKVREVTRSDVSALITRMKNTPVTANRVLSCLRKMFNMAEVWGFRDDGTNPCRHIPKSRVRQDAADQLCTRKRRRLSSFRRPFKETCCRDRYTR
jgi:hypothetical protein